MGTENERYEVHTFEMGSDRGMFYVCFNEKTEEDHFYWGPCLGVKKEYPKQFCLLCRSQSMCGLRAFPTTFCDRCTGIAREFIRLHGYKDENND